MITCRTGSGIIVKIMTWQEYKQKKRKQFNKYKQSHEYQLWENSHKNNKV